MSDKLISIGNRIKLVRGAKTQGEFASELGVSQPSVYGWENDKGVSIETLIKIANTYSVNMNWLLLGEGEMRSEYKKNTTSVFDVPEPRLLLDYIESLKDQISLLKDKILLLENKSNKGKVKGETDEYDPKKPNNTD
jgi:transcriptional regulator with XRE-family HTH domain